MGILPLCTLLSVADLLIFVSFNYITESFIYFLHRNLFSFCQSLPILGQIVDAEEGIQVFCSA